MGFLSSLFGYEDKPAVTSKVSTIPPELKPYVDEAMKDTQALYKQRMGEGYKPYAGDTIAGLTPEQIASQEGLKSLVGTQVPFQQEALGMFREGAERFTPETAKQFMSPYQRAVIDQEKEQAQRQYERTKRPEFEADAVRAGGMSGLGSRAAIESAEREDLQARFLGDIETRGLQAAYKDAQAQFTDQKARERTVGTDVATAGGNIFSAGLAEQGLLKDIGAEKQGLAQSALDEAYFKFKKEQGFPEEQLSRYQSSIYGNPLLSQPNYTQTKTPEQASMGKSLIGLGLSGLKAFGGGSALGGIGKAASGIKSFFGNAGGQIGGLPTLYRENGGQTKPNFYGGYDLAALQQMDNREEQEFQTGQTATVKRNPQDFKDARIAAGVEPPVQPTKTDIAVTKVVEGVGGTGAATKLIKDVKNKAAAKGDKLPPEFTRKSVAENVAQIKGTAGDNLMAGLAAYLKPFGTPADILGAQTAAESKRNIDAAKEELKMTSEEEKAYAKIRAEQIKANASSKKYKASEALATWKNMGVTNGLFDLGPDGKVLNLKGVLVSDDPKEAARTRIKINKLLVDAERKGEETGLQSDATNVIANGMAEIIGIKKDTGVKQDTTTVNGVTYIKDSTGKWVKK